MGSELNVGAGAGEYNLWLNLLKIARQGLDILKLDSAGANPSDGITQISAKGLLVKYYGEMLLSLGARWNVQPYPYDWRRDLETEAVGLHRFIREKFAGKPVSIVAHSMGGLVARALWKSSPKADSGEPLLRRLIMLGTPNLGSFEVPMIFAGIQDTVKKLIMLTHPFLSVFNHDEARRRLLSVISSFPGVYQMAPQKGFGADILRKAAAYQAVNKDVVQAHLNRGVDFFQRLENVVDPDRMIYVAGYGFETIVGVDTSLPLDRLSSYWANDAGDGKVPHELGLLKDVPTYYVHEQHGNLPANSLVQGALDDLLQKGKTSTLPTQVPADRSLSSPRRPKRLEGKEDEFDFALGAEEWANRVKGTRGEDLRIIDPEEIRLEDEILKGWVPQRGEDGQKNDRIGGGSAQIPGDSEMVRIDSNQEPIRLQLRLIRGDLASSKLIDQLSPSVDAIAMGIYENQRRTWSAIRKIDLSIDPTAATPENPGLLGDLIGRGMVKGNLAVPTLVPAQISSSRVLVTLC
jgi:pimeloyl-ACP methyl ester carboxylesterase